MLPIVTIGLPVLNEEPFVEDAVRSVFAQSFSDWELVIVDDGSTDGGLKKLKQLLDNRVTLVSDGCWRGLGARLNQIVATARGKYIARMDADDLMHPERITRQIEYLEQNRDLDVVGCGVVSFDAGGEPMSVRRFPQTHEGITAAPLKGILLAHATTVGRTDWWRSHPYDEVTRACEDVELWLSTYRSSRFANLAEPLYFYREGQSYSLAGYAAAKAELAGLMWRHRREYGAAALWASLAQWPRIAAYALAHVIGADEKLVRRRGTAAGEAEVDEFRRAVEQIRKTELPLNR